MLPPYAKPLYQCQLNHEPPNNDIYLYIGQKSWDRAKLSAISRPTRTLCLPPDISPFAYDWPVALCDILIVETAITNEELIDELTAVLFKESAVIIRYIDQNGNLTVFKRI